MWDILVYVYETYWQPADCPEPGLLGRKLQALGFEDDDIEDALHWLSGLRVSAAASGSAASQPAQDTRSGSSSVRIYTAEERVQLGQPALSYLAFLEANGVLGTEQRECVIERALAAGVGPIDVADLKTIVLMVFWSQGHEPNGLVLDELFDDEDSVSTKH